MVLNVPVVALNFVIVAPAPTTADAGTLSTGSELVSVITNPPVGAAADSVAKQVVDAFGPTMLGLHATADIDTGTFRLTVAVAELLL